MQMFAYSQSVVDFGQIYSTPGSCQPRLSSMFVGDASHYLISSLLSQHSWTSSYSFSFCFMTVGIHLAHRALGFLLTDVLRMNSDVRNLCLLKRCLCYQFQDLRRSQCVARAPSIDLKQHPESLRQIYNRPRWMNTMIKLSVYLFIDSFICVWVCVMKYKDMD